MARVRWFALAALVCAAVAGRPSRAHAQGCHVLDVRPTQKLGFRVSALASFATYRNPSYEGEYQGYTGAAAFAHPWFSIEASITGYRIVRNGLREYGPGDLMLMARGRALRVGDDAAVGIALGASLPTGDADKGLGMGHTMLMPGAWFGFSRGGLNLVLDVAYGRAVGGGSSHHADGGPIVNPMNRSELEHVLALDYTFWHTLFVVGRLYGAVAVADVNGRAREAAGLGLGGRVSYFEFAVEQHLPLAGTPFESKTLLRVSASF
ncbi:MAG TPA: hypothetical protein VFZ61_09515 [Polyangiales bacterium]